MKVGKMDNPAYNPHSGAKLRWDIVTASDETTGFDPVTGKKLAYGSLHIHFDEKANRTISISDKSGATLYERTQNRSGLTIALQNSLPIKPGITQVAPGKTHGLTGFWARLGQTLINSSIIGFSATGNFLAHRP